MDEDIKVKKEQRKRVRKANQDLKHIRSYKDAEFLEDDDKYFDEDDK